MSEAVMIALARKGMSRQKAHEHLRRLAIKSEMEKRPFKRVLSEDKTVQKLLSTREISKVLNPRNYLGTAVKQVKLVIRKTRQERKKRGLKE
jgi:adenylosuccinate lyase